MNLKKNMSLCSLLLIGMTFSPLCAQKPILKFKTDKTFKIVQFTDLHIKHGDPASEIAFERMNQVMDDEKPDYVIFTGDIIYSKPACENMRKVLKTVSDRKIPFSIVFGNHDEEQGTSKDSLLMVAQSLPYNLTEDEVPEISGVGNYTLPIRSADGGKDAAVLYCFDSQSYSKIKEVKGYDYIKTDQVNWYRTKSDQFAKANNGAPVPSLAFFHIALPEYLEAASDPAAQLYGIRREKVCSPPLNSGLFTSMKEKDDVMGIFVGHDHDDDYAVAWYGILLAYGRFTGGNTEYNHLPNGARVIVLTEGSRSFSTWIRTEKGIEQSVNFPADFTR